MGKGQRNNSKGRSKGRGRNFAKGSRQSGPPPAAARYAGPIIPRTLRTNDHMDIIRLTLVTSVQSTVAGNLGFGQNIDPTITDQWGTVKGLFQEMRPLAARFRYVARFPLWGNTTGQSEAASPMVMWVNRDSTISVPTVYNIAWRISDSSVKSINQNNQITWRMSGTNEAAWGNTSVASWAVGAMGLTASTLLSPSTIYGELFTEILVQFRGLRY